MEDPLNTEQLLLDSVNILLETINELPLEEAEDFAQVVEARQAKGVLLETKRSVLSEGWDFNKDTDWKFPLDVNGMIPVPTNVLDITANRADVIMRNWRLYSKRNQSHIFTEEVPCTVVWLFDFNNLSHPIRHYITIRAARIFMARVIGDKEVIGFNEVDEEDARIAARRSESLTGRYNMLSSGVYGQNNLISRN